jgi:hypothetical protein
LSNSRHFWRLARPLQLTAASAQQLPQFAPQAESAQADFSGLRLRGKAFPWQQRLLVLLRGQTDNRLVQVAAVSSFERADVSVRGDAEQLASYQPRHAARQGCELHMPVAAVIRWQPLEKFSQAPLAFRSAL